MSGTLNKVMLIGHLGDDVKIHRFEDGGCVGRFPLATNETYLNRQTNERVSNAEWHNIVLVRNDNNFKFYLDGNVEIETTYNPAGGDLTGQNQLRIGSLGGNEEYFEGLLDDIRIWNTALSQNDVISNFNLNNIVQSDNLVGYWPMHEGDGVDVYDSAGGTVLYDQSGYSNNGEIWYANLIEQVSNIDLCCLDEYNDADGDGVCESDEIYGCTDINGCNFGEEFTELCIEESTEYINGNCDLCNYPDINYDCSGNCLDLGDLNFDGEHNIQDIVIMVDIILENSEFNVCSDINIDSFANIFDLIMLIDIILE